MPWLAWGSRQSNPAPGCLCTAARESDHGIAEAAVLRHIGLGGCDQTRAGILQETSLF
jgi:hypothetical protein